MEAPSLDLFVLDPLHDAVSDFVVFRVHHDVPVLRCVEASFYLVLYGLQLLLLKSLEHESLIL